MDKVTELEYKIAIAEKRLANCKSEYCKRDLEKYLKRLRKELRNVQGIIY